MRIEIISCLQDNYSYLIIDETNNNACVVDPSEAKPIINFLENKDLKLKYILNTHHHFDHIGGNKELKKKYKSIVIGYKNDADIGFGFDGDGDRCGVIDNEGNEIFSEKIGERITGLGVTEDVNAPFYKPVGLVERYEYS